MSNGACPQTRYTVHAHSKFCTLSPPSQVFNIQIFPWMQCWLRSRGSLAVHWCGTPPEISDSSPPCITHAHMSGPGLITDIFPNWSSPKLLCECPWMLVRTLDCYSVKKKTHSKLKYIQTFTYLPYNTIISMESLFEVNFRVKIHAQYKILVNSKISQI